MKKVFKILLLIIIPLFLLKSTCYATEIETFDRETLDNYGVNKKWKIIDDNKDNVLNTKKVDASKLVYDFSNILTDEEEEKIYNLFTNFKEKTGITVVFLSDELAYYDDSKNEEHASDFYDYNDFGLDNDSYSGIILYRNTYEEDKYYGVYAFGEAQLYYYDDTIDEILDDIYWDISSGYYYDGVKLFVDELNKYYEKGPLENYYVDENGYLQKYPAKLNYGIMIAVCLAISIVITEISVSANKKKNFMVKEEETADTYLDKENIKIDKKIDKLLSSHTSKFKIEHYSSSGGSSGGGHFSSGGSSGGGHSGGGRHG